MPLNKLHLSCHRDLKKNGHEPNLQQLVWSPKLSGLGSAYTLEVHEPLAIHTLDRVPVVSERRWVPKRVELLRGIALLEEVCHFVGGL